MDALLGQLGIGAVARGDPARSNYGCDSVDELQRQMHNVFATKKTETRAEHISASFEMRISSVFHIADDTDTDAPEVFEQLQKAATRTVNASDTVLNQPTDDPKLQISVAKHLVGALQAVDDSTWDLRQAYRQVQGWTFTYECEHSLQAWNSRNASNSERPPIGAFSGAGGLDHVNLSRPAFDCRGTLTITFSKSSKAIIVKYEHTPLHKTVAELVDRLLPTLLSPPVASGNTPSAIRSAKAKRPPPAGGEANGCRKQKKEDKAAETLEAEDGTHSGAHSEAPVVTPIYQATPVLQIPPEEAARRRDVAIRLLTSRGIRPDALSAEQMDIFSNQAPHLQALSLDMLAEYGPERLRIIHPEAKDHPGSSSTSVQQASPANGLINTSTPVAGTPTTKAMSRNKPEVTVIEITAIGNDDVSTLNAEAIPAASKSQSSRKKTTRGACNTCKLAKRKCTKEHPQCSVCIERGETCLYLAPIPRSRKSEMSAVALKVSDLDNTSQAVNHASYAPPVPEQAMQIVEPVRRVPDYEDDEFIPDPNILAGPIDQPLPPSSPSQSQDQPNDHQPDTAQVSLPGPFTSSSAPQYHNFEMPRHESSSNDPGSASTVQVTQPARPVANTAIQRQYASNWAGSPYSPALAECNSTQSAAISMQEPSKRPGSRLSGTGSDTQAFGSFQAAAVLSKTPIPASYQSKPAVITRPPNQNRTLGHNIQNYAREPRSRGKFGQERTSHQITGTRTSSSPSDVSATHNITWKTPFHPPASSSNTTSSPSHDQSARYNTTSHSHYSQSGSDQSSRIAYTPQPFAQTTTPAMSNSYTASHYDHFRGVASNNPFAQEFDETSGYGNAFGSNAEQWVAQNHSSPSNTPT